MAVPEKQNPPGQAGVASAKTKQAGHCDDIAARLPSNWRERLPNPTQYYSLLVPNLAEANALGWARGQCPFHRDEANSLTVHVNGPRGAWRCDAGCGSGDLLGFHQRLTGRSFKDAVRDLLEGVL